MHQDVAELLHVCGLPERERDRALVDVITRGREQRANTLADAYRKAFENAATLKERCEILHAYVSRFLDRAFDPHRWLYGKVLAWRANRTPEHQRLLRAVVKGVSAPVEAYFAGPLDRRALKRVRLAEARRCREALSSSLTIQDRNQWYTETRRKPGGDLRSNAQQRFNALRLAVERELVRQKAPRVSSTDVTAALRSDRQLSRALRRIVARAFGVPVRDLH